MKFTKPEDRLNPIPSEGVDESTLGGYPAVHGRAPAFEGMDGLAYTAAIEAELTEDGEGWVAYLVFLRWAAEGSAIMGHLETPDLARGATRAEAIQRIESTSLVRVKALLDEMIELKRVWDADSGIDGGE